MGRGGVKRGEGSQCLPISPYQLRHNMTTCTADYLLLEFVLTKSPNMRLMKAPLLASGVRRRG